MSRACVPRQQLSRPARNLVRCVSICAMLCTCVCLTGCFVGFLEHVVLDLVAGCWVRAQGVRRRVAIAHSGVVSIDCRILDEPRSGLRFEVCLFDGVRVLCVCCSDAQMWAVGKVDKVAVKVCLVSTAVCADSGVRSVKQSHCPRRPCLRWCKNSAHSMCICSASAITACNCCSRSK